MPRRRPLVPESESLLEVIHLKILARRLGVAAVDYQHGEVVLTVAKATQIDPQRLVDLLSQGRGLRVTPDQKIYAPSPPLASGAAGLFEAARDVLTLLSA